MKRVLSIGCFLSVALPALAGPAWQDPTVFTELANAQALRLRPQAQLYSIDSTVIDSRTPCSGGAWKFVYYADVDETVDASKVEKIEVSFQPVPDAQFGCLWGIGRRVTHGEAKPWGMLPLTTFARASLSLGQQAAEKYLGGPLQLEHFSIFHPDLASVPAAIFVMGEFCGGKTFVQVNAATGEVYDAPVKPTCP